MVDLGEWPGGAGPPYFLGHTEAQKAKKNFWRPPPLSEGQDLPLNSLLLPSLGVGNHQDDEYAWAGVQDPKIMITTSHNPSSRLKQFAKVNKYE